MQIFQDPSSACGESCRPTAKLQMLHTSVDGQHRLPKLDADAELLHTTTNKFALCHVKNDLSETADSVRVINTPRGYVCEITLASGFRIVAHA